MAETPGEKLIASNPFVRSNFVLVEIVEAGLALTGTEVKSLRTQTPNLKDSFVEVHAPRKGGSLEAWLVNAHIPPYSHGNIWNHDPVRRRKLLLHEHQIRRMHGALTRDGMTVVPTRLYFKKGRAKIELALAKGKRKGDKRDDVKRKQADKEMSQALKRQGRE